MNQPSTSTNIYETICVDPSPASSNEATSENIYETIEDIRLHHQQQQQQQQQQQHHHLHYHHSNLIRSQHSSMSSPVPSTSSATQSQQQQQQQQQQMLPPDEQLIYDLNNPPDYLPSCSSTYGRIGNTYGRIDIIGHGIGRIERHLSSSCGSINSNHYVLESLYGGSSSNSNTNTLDGTSTTTTTNNSGRISKVSVQWLLANKWLPLWIANTESGKDYRIIDFLLAQRAESDESLENSVGNKSQQQQQQQQQSSEQSQQQKQKDEEDENEPGPSSQP